MILALLFAAAAGATPAADTVVVLPFAAQQPWAGVAVADALVDHVAQVNKDNFVTLRQLAAVLRRRGVAVGSPQATAQVDVAKPLGATEIVTGTLARSGDRVQLTARLLKDGKEVTSASAEGAHAALPVLARQLGLKLFGATTKAPLLARSADGLELAAQCSSLAFAQPVDPRSRTAMDPAAAAQGEAACRDALAKDPQLGLAHAGLSILLTAQKKYADALAEAEQAGKDRFVAEAVLAEQFAARRSGNVARAHEALEQAVAARPGFLIALGYLAEERYDAHDDVGAAAIYDRYLARAPNHPWALAQKAHSLARMGQKDEAVALSRKALEAAPGDPELSVELASRLIDAGKDADAEPLLRGAADATPPRPLAGLRLGYLMLRKDRLDEAQGMFRKVLSDAKNADEAHARGVAHADLARIAAKRDDFPSAVTELTAARAEGLEALPCAEPAIARWKQKPELQSVCAPSKSVAPVAESEDDAASVDF